MNTKKEKSMEKLFVHYTAILKQYVIVSLGRR